MKNSTIYLNNICIFGEQLKQIGIMKTLNQDVKNLKNRISYQVKKASTPRQNHFDNVARELGYADSNIAFKHLGKVFIEKAKVNAPCIKLN